MPNLYQYRVRDKSGVSISGSIRGDNVEAVENYLESLDLIPVRIRRQSEFSLKQLLKFGRMTASLEDLILVTRKLSTLYRSGVPIMRALEIVADQYEEEPLGEVLLSVRDDMERGENLSDSLARYPRIFKPIYVSSVRAAEAAGKLDSVLDSLSVAMEQELVTREEVKKALRYPTMVVIAIVAAFMFLTIFIIPRFAGFYSQHGAGLPLPTQVMISVSEMVRNSWYVLLPAIVILLVVFGRALRLNRLRRSVDSFLLKLPVFGDLFVKTSLSRFAHLLSVLIASGTPLIRSLEIVRDAVGNVIIGDEVGRFAEGLKEGRSIDDTRHQMRHFPKLVISLVHVGMESGTLDLTLKEISRFFDREVHYSSGRLTSALEPILIVVMGAMILFLALGIFLPMWNLIQVFR